MNLFPYTNFHDINLDWIIKNIKSLITRVTNLESSGGGGGSGTTDYNDLSNKPSINGNELSGNKTTSQLGITIPNPYTSNPAALGTANPGSSNNYSRGDHVHEKPTYSASDVNAIALPANPTSGDFLVYNGSAWAAVTMAEWQGGSY